jgi:hypothetical protein
MGKALLIIVVGFSMIFSVVMFNVSANQSRSTAAIAVQYEKWMAHNAAESVANVAISRLFQNFNNLGTLSGSFNGATYSTSVANVTSDSAVQAKRIRVTTVSNFGDESDTTIVELMQPAYSYYYYLSREWPTWKTFVTGDTIPAPIHSNQSIRISGSPVFLGKVSSTNTSFTTVVSASPQFLGGAEFGCSFVPYPSLTGLGDSLSAFGHVHSQELWVTFNGDGTFACSTATIEHTNNVADYQGVRTSDEEHIHVQGTFTGQFTVLSDEDLYIEGDIRYLTDPRVDPTSTDLLGLVARNDIIINKNTDLEIHGALLAREYVRVPYRSSLPIKTLTILGSIGQRNGEEFSVLGLGYNLTHVYDDRLRAQTPPYFPRLFRATDGRPRVELLYRSK